VPKKEYLQKLRRFFPWVEHYRQFESAKISFHQNLSVNGFVRVNFFLQLVHLGGKRAQRSRLPPRQTAKLPNLRFPRPIRLFFLFRS
jgi:hypothetical protein